MEIIERLIYTIPSKYANYVRCLKIKYFDYRYEKKWGNEFYEIFGNVINLDYVIKLSTEQMPLHYLFESKNKRIPNFSHKDRFSDMHDTEIDRVTSYELLGFFAEVNESLIKELKENGFIQYRFQPDNTEIFVTISVDDLKDKRVIFICEELIHELCDNISSIETKDELARYFNLDNDYLKENDKIMDDVKEWFRFENMLKFVFYHEFGHCAFYDINQAKKIDDPAIKERQANYFASLVFNGTYDKLIEIYNNYIGREYENPLLQSHQYLWGNHKFREEESKLYGE